MNRKELSASAAGEISLGNEISVHRLGYGAMRLTGEGIWGPPKDRKAALTVLRRAVDLGVNFIDTADSYGPYVNEELIAEALFPYPVGLVIATKGGWERPRAQSVDSQCNPRSSSQSSGGKLEEAAPRSH
jgi:pyridoxine 4-dehydrogenase